MGTSSSFRSPPQPRWNAFVGALTGGEAPDRVRSELFNAGIEWEEALSAAAIASFASSIANLYDELPNRVDRAGGVDVAVGNLLAEAKSASREAGFSPAAAVAERAYARLLLAGLGSAGSADINEVWTVARGPSRDALVVRYLSEVVGEYARHAVSREVGRLSVAGEGVARSRATTSSVSDAAASVASAAGAAALSAGGSIQDRWASAVRAVFAAGRQLPAANT